MTKLGRCVEWKGTRDAKGYGRIWFRKSWMPAQRYVFELFYGEEIPPGMMVLHHCDNPPCVKLAHLYVGDTRDNALDRERRKRGVNSRKTQCPQGHKYTPENTRTKYGRRECLICMRARLRLYYRRSKIRASALNHPDGRK